MMDAGADAVWAGDIGGGAVVGWWVDRPGDILLAES